ncbi:MAG: hypothetical protein HQM10_06655 [Candidatus Riflebacteria bacterium]|nr:hypothetical protein [Candidatus Riflebacteria bacterium]
MSNTNDVPENIQPFLNEIAERLWSDHAAVMVGAGFSKNAEPIGTSSSGFPDWNQLGDLFFEKIHAKFIFNGGSVISNIKATADDENKQTRNTHAI